MRGLLWPLCLCVLLGSLSGCSDKTSCTHEGYYCNLAVILRAAEGELPAGLVIELVHYQTLVANFTLEKDSTGDILPMGSGFTSCEEYYVGDVGDPRCHDELNNCIFCTWGNVGPGTFDATAAGYRPVHVELMCVEVDRDSCGHSSFAGGGADVVLERL